MTLQLHKPDGHGGLERRAVQDSDWRKQLRSPRWGTRVGFRHRMPALANPEMNPTSNARAVMFWFVLAAATFGVLLIGYGTGFWH